MLPQFAPIDQIGFDEKDTQKSKRKMDRLRQHINDSLWAGVTTQKSELVSLNDIIRMKTLESEDANPKIEQYVRLNNLFETEGD